MISVAAIHLPPPNPSPLRILIRDDTAVDAELAVAALEEAGCTCDWERVDNREAFLKRLSESTYDLSVRSRRSKWSCSRFLDCARGGGLFVSWLAAAAGRLDILRR